MEISSETLSLGVSIVFLLLALVYTLADYDTIFNKDRFIDKKWAFPLKYALGYVGGYAAVIVKAILVLLFIYVFIVVYNLAIVGIFKPLLTDNVDSSASIKLSSGAGEIIDKARGTYFDAIKQVVKSMMPFTFGFIDVPQLLVLMFVIIPVFLFVTSFAYYYAVSHKKVDDDTQRLKEMTTTYHMFMVFMFTLIVVMCIFSLLWVFLGT